jgi:hypothetical protein
VISKDCFTHLCPNRRIIVGFFIELSDSVLKSTESLNKGKGAVNTHINASSDASGCISSFALGQSTERVFLLLRFDSLW